MQHPLQLHRLENYKFLSRYICTEVGIVNFQGVCSSLPPQRNSGPREISRALSRGFGLRGEIFFDVIVAMKFGPLSCSQDRRAAFGTRDGLIHFSPATAAAGFLR